MPGAGKEMSRAATVWRCLKPYGWLCLGAAAIVLIEANCELLLPAMMSTIIDEGVRRRDMELILRTGGKMVLAALAGIACVLGRNVCSGTASQQFGAGLRRELYAKLLRLTEAGAGQLGDASVSTRVLNDSDQLAKSLNSALRIGIKTPALCLGSIFYAMRMDAGLSGVAAVVVSVVLALIVWYMRLSGRRFHRVRSAMDRVNTTVQEFLRGVRLVKALGLEQEQDGRFQEANHELTQSGIQLQLLSAWFAPLITLTVNAGIVILLGLAGLWSVEAGKVSALATYMTRLLTSLMTLIDVFKLLIRANTAAVRIQEVLELPEERNPDHPSALRETGPTLEFQSVRFSYPGSGGRTALDHVSFSVNRGEVLAVVGPTGAGKSTLAKLCVWLYAPDVGAVRLNGQPMEVLSREDIRRQVSVAGGQGWLFSGSVRRNLSIAAPDAAEEDLWTALRDAQADGFVAQAGGLDAVLEQGGVNLSGGQRQRLALAQALARKSEALILDDCTSALDPATEQGVLAEVWKRREQAVVLITQRLRNARHADRVLVLENGRVLGLGKHDELLESCPVYQEMWRAQIWEDERDEAQR